MSSDTNRTNGLIMREALTQAIEEYYTQLEGECPGNVYELVLGEVERPLLEVTLKHTNNNQSKAAEMLGLNRGTLRKKLKQFDLL